MEQTTTTATPAVPEEQAAAKNLQLVVFEGTAIQAADGFEGLVTSAFPTFAEISKLTPEQKVARVKNLWFKDNNPRQAVLEVGAPFAVGALANRYLNEVIPVYAPMLLELFRILKINAKMVDPKTKQPLPECITWKKLGIVPTQSVNYGHGKGKQPIKETDPVGVGSYCAEILRSGSSYITALAEGKVFRKLEAAEDEGNSNQPEAAPPPAPEPQQEPEELKRGRSANQPKDEGKNPEASNTPDPNKSEAAKKANQTRKAAAPPDAGKQVFTDAVRKYFDGIKEADLGRVLFLLVRELGYSTEQTRSVLKDAAKYLPSEKANGAAA